MNSVILMGRLAIDPELKYGGQKQTAISRFSLAVDKRMSKGSEGQTADFFDCISFGKTAEFVDKYLKKGTKVVLRGRLQNNNYTRNDGVKIYSTQVAIDDIEFAESKKAADTNSGNTVPAAPSSVPNDAFMTIPDAVDDADLPFN